MENTEIGTELNSIKREVSMLVGAFDRLENAVGQIISIDKDVAGLQIEHGHLNRYIKDVEHDVKNCNVTHKLADEVLHRRIDEVTSKIEETARIASAKSEEIKTRADAAHLVVGNYISKNDGAISILRWIIGGSAASILGVVWWAVLNVNDLSQKMTEFGFSINVVKQQNEFVKDALILGRQKP